VFREVNYTHTHTHTRRAEQPRCGLGGGGAGGERDSNATKWHGLIELIIPRGVGWGTRFKRQKIAWAHRTNNTAMASGRAAASPTPPVKGEIRAGAHECTNDYIHKQMHVASSTNTYTLRRSKGNSGRGPMSIQTSVQTNTLIYKCMLRPQRIQNTAATAVAHGAHRAVVTLRGQSRIRYSLPPPGFGEFGIHVASATCNPLVNPLDSFKFTYRDS